MCIENLSWIYKWAHFHPIKSSLGPSLTKRAYLDSHSTLLWLDKVILVSSNDGVLVPAARSPRALRRVSQILAAAAAAAASAREELIPRIIPQILDAPDSFPA